MVASVKVDTAEMERAVAEWGEDMRRAVEIAGQRAVMKTAYKVLEAEQKEMARVFDRATRFTINAFRVAAGGREAMQGGQMRAVAGSTIAAEVKPKDGYWYRADNYLNTQIVGGDRKAKAFERALAARGLLPPGWLAVPGQKAKLDGNGNMSVGEIKQILSWFNSAEPYAGSTQNMTDATRAKRRKGTRTKLGFEYFAVVPGRTLRSGGRQQLHPGVYRRTFFGFGAAIEPILIFIQSASYKPRFDFYGIGQRVVADNFGRLFQEFFNAQATR